jgi:hypothetical protein
VSGGKGNGRRQWRKSWRDAGATNANGEQQILRRFAPQDDSEGQRKRRGTGNALLPGGCRAVLYFSTCSLQTGFRAGAGRKRGWRTLRVAVPGRWVYR